MGAIKAKPLRIFTFGPGIGESIIVQLPCGSWGVVDCYQPATSSGGTVDLLKALGVKRLAFFCHTHPHDDHYHGAHLLFDHFAGRIDRIWRHPGFSARDIETQRNATRRVVLAAKVKHLRSGVARAKEAADEYELLMAAISAEKKKIDPRDYRRISGEITLMTGDGYEISSLAPNGDVLDEVEERLGNLNANAGFIALSDDDGEFLNSLSVVLHIKFGASDIFLLADSQGDGVHIHASTRRCAVVKVAHHGSHNGLAAGLITATPSEYVIKHLLMTPYKRSTLPRADMLQKYRSACPNLHLTSSEAIGGVPNVSVLGTLGGSSHEAASWVCLNISSRGLISKRKVSLGPGVP